MKFCVFSTELFARETFEFNLGQKINVLSDKAFRKSSENEFEAIGNVVVTHLKNTIYGERAKVNFTTGGVEVVGNVRYIDPHMTLYGTKIQYNFLSREIKLENARMISDNYVVTGKKFTQNKPEFIYAEEAEYTTCRDCPESWSVFGRQVNIEVGKYVRIKHAFLKINGVVAMYIPYIIFPIKKKRESGVLFPMLGFSSKEGLRYQQPFFWAINDFMDATITPSTFGNRGLGGDLQYRQVFLEKTWFELNTLQMNDLVYAPYKSSKNKTGDRYYRHFSDYEFHSLYKHYFNNHFYFSNTSDIDTTRDYDFFTKDKVRGTEVGGGGFLEGRNSLFSIGMEGYFNRNTLTSDPREFDHRYVQLLPKLYLNSVPFNVIQGNYPFLKNISLGMNLDFTVFKQNKVDTTGPIRNARRLNLGPYLKWQLGNLGPFFFSHQLKLDYQKYNLPTERDDFFLKKGLIYESEVKFEIDRIFGLSYNEPKPIDPNNLEKEKEKDRSLQTTIGDLPSLKNNGANLIEMSSYDSYRHSQEYKLKHYYLSDQKNSGNNRFRSQIENDDGQFDYFDAIRAKEHLTAQVTAKDSLPLSNTLEFQWNNRLIKKSAKIFDPYIDERYLKDNFIYSNMAYFDVSQGLDLNIHSSEKKMIDRLTRLYVNTGITFNRTSLGIQEFYFHKTSEHKFSTNVSQSFDRAVISGRFTYDSFNSQNTPITKLIGYNVLLKASDLLVLKNSLDYNIQTKTTIQSSYSFIYSPLNNCWKIELNYARDLIEKRLGVLIYINYNENNFKATSVR